MSKEQAMSYATHMNPITPEVRSSPVTGMVPENAKEAANPAVENGGVVPQPMVSSQLNHLAKKEAKLLAEREAFKKEQEEFQVLRTRAQEFYDKAKAFEDTRKADPIKAMKDLGFTEKEIIDYLSQEEAPKASTEEIVQAELKKYKEEEQLKVVEAQKVNDQKLITQFRTTLSSIVTKDPEKYELCAHHGAVAEEIMFELALQEAKEGKIPNPESIAQEVEDFYYQQFEAMSKLKKLTPKEQAVLEAAKPERTRVVHPPQDVVKPKATTLTNRIAATTAAIAKPANRTETREEKRSRLEALIRNGLTR